MSESRPRQDQEPILALSGEDEDFPDLRQRLFEQVLEESRNEIYIFDAESLHFIAANRAARENLGYSMEELRLLTPLDLKPEFPAERFLRLVEPLLRGHERLIRFETVHRRKDGSEYPVDVHLQLSRVGERPLFFAVILDTSSRKAVEAAFRESEQRFRALADNIPQLAWMADENGWIFWYNERWYEYTGTTLEEVRGWGWRKVHHPDHVDRVVERISRHWETGEPWEDTFPLRSRTGEYRWFLSRASPIQGEDGRVRRWFGTGTDITEQLRSAEELEHLSREIDRQRSLLQAVTDNATCALIMLDEGGRVTFWNPAARRITGYDAAEARNRTLHDLIHRVTATGEPRPAESCRIVGAIRDGVPLEDHEDLFVRKDRVFFHGVCAARPIRDEGRVLGTVVEIRDVTEHRRAEEALRAAKEEAERANRAKSDFLAAMSHELRTPLNAIAGYLDLIDLGIHGPVSDGQREAIGRIKRNEELLLTLINDILHFAKMETGRLQLSLTDFPLAELLERLEDMVAPQARVRGLEYRHSSCAPDLYVRGDAERIQQILLNLVSNATKYTGEGGHVELRCEVEDERVLVQVVDDGPGIPETKLERIFDPFVQLERHRYEARQPGVGLGLAISRELARSMGADLTVRSQLGRGSTFTLSLPRARPA